MIRDIPKYEAPLRFQPADNSKRPALVLDMNGVLMLTYTDRGDSSEVPNLEASAHYVFEEPEDRCLLF